MRIGRLLAFLLNSNTHPHFITVKRSGQSCRDSECLNWKSPCMCVLTVAVVEKEGDLNNLLSGSNGQRRLQTSPSWLELKCLSKKKRKMTSSERIKLTAVCGFSNSQSSTSTKSTKVGEDLQQTKSVYDALLVNSRIEYIPGE